jgi:hypothetical protein
VNPRQIADMIAADLAAMQSGEARSSGFGLEGLVTIAWQLGAMRIA